MNTKFQVKINTSIDNFNEEEWNNLAIYSSVFAEYGWFKTYEGSLSDEQYYIQVLNNDKIIIILPCYIIKDENVHQWHNIFNIFQESNDFNWDRLCFFSADLIKSAIFPNLIVTAPQGYISEVIAVEETLEEIYQELFTVLDEIATKHQVRVKTFLWVQDKQETLQKILIKQNYQRIFLGADNFFEINQWKTFDEYLNIFEYKRRNSIKKEIEKFDQSNQKISEVKCNSQAIREIVDLQYNLQKKYNVVLDKKSFFAELSLLAKYYSNEMKTFLVHKEGKVTGFLIGFEKNNIFYLKFAGFDYEEIKGTCSYFNLCYYYILKKYINTSIKRIEYGGGSFEAKLLRGCKMSPLLGYFKVQDNTDEALQEFMTSINEYSKAKETFYYYLEQKFANRREMV